MRTPFRDSERIAVQDAAEQRNLQNTELLSNCGSKIEFGMLEMPENLDAMQRWQSYRNHQRYPHLR